MKRFFNLFMNSRAAVRARRQRRARRAPAVPHEQLSYRLVARHGVRVVGRNRAVQRRRAVRVRAARVDVGAGAQQHLGDLDGASPRGRVQR